MVENYILLLITHHRHRFHSVLSEIESLQAQKLINHLKVIEAEK